MRLLVSGATPAVARLGATAGEYLGVLMTPGGGPGLDWIERTGLEWAADNGCFSGFDEPAFERMLERIAGASRRPRFVVSPDVPFDARATLNRLVQWSPIIRGHGLPVALAGQNGLEEMAVPWDSFDAFFIGGDTAWKESDATLELAHTARGLGKWVHMGRVNSLLRMTRAYDMGCDSVDGTGFTWYSDKRIPMALRWLKRIHAQRTLWR